MLKSVDITRNNDNSSRSVLNFCVRLVIMHHKLIRFKTSFIFDAMIELET